MAKAKHAVPEGFHTLTPQLALDNAAQAIDWYKKAFGAEEVSRAVGPDGKIMHADLRIGDSHVMMNDVMMGGKGPKAMGGSPMMLWIYVPDCDALFKRAVMHARSRRIPRLFMPFLSANAPIMRIAQRFGMDIIGCGSDVGASLKLQPAYPPGPGAP
jgi:catechol 2,3-dioxygenase-like lactoylglutathione lyase family enzyme